MNNDQELSKEELQELSKEELQEYQELVDREYERIEKQKLFKNCKHCGKKIMKYGLTICNDCYRPYKRWGSDSGRVIDISHILALAIDINKEFKASKELIDKVKEIRKLTCKTDRDKNLNLSKEPLNNTEYAVALLVVLYFTQERNVIESGEPFKTYIVYVLINKVFLRDSRRKRMSVYDSFEELNLLQKMFADYKRFLDYLDGRVLKRYYEKGNFEIFE